MEFSLVSWIVRMSMFSWVRSCCSLVVLFCKPFTLISSILSCLFLGCGLFVAEVYVCGRALSCVACSGGVLWVVDC